MIRIIKHSIGLKYLLNCIYCFCISVYYRIIKNESASLLINLYIIIYLMAFGIEEVLKQDLLAIQNE